LDPKNEKSRIIPFSVILSFCFFAIYVYCVVFEITDDDSLIEKYALSKFLVIGDKVRIVVISTLIIILILVNFYRISLYSTLMKTLLNTDEHLNDLGIKINYTKLAYSVNFLAIAYFSLNIAYLIFNACVVLYWNIDPPYKLVIVICIPSFIFSFGAIIFTSITHILKRYIVLLTDLMTKLHKERKPSFLTASTWTTDGEFVRRKITVSSDRRNTNQVINKLKQLWNVYNSICDSLDVCQDLFSLRFIIFFLATFVAIVVNEFFIMSCVIAIQQGLYRFVPLLLFVIQQWSQYVIILISMVTGCSECEKHVSVICKYNCIYTIT
jgi:hypothetical protein